MFPITALNGLNASATPAMVTPLGGEVEEMSPVTPESPSSDISVPSDRVSIRFLPEV